MTTAKHLVFVYGSLKAGFHNARLLHSAKLIGKATTVSRYYTMLSAGHFPVVMRTKDKRVSGRAAITGELYEVDDSTFRDLDGLESNGHMYLRRQVFVNVEMPNPFGPNGGGLSQPLAIRHKAWMYVGVSKFWRPRNKHLRRVRPNAETLTWLRGVPW